MSDPKHTPFNPAKSCAGTSKWALKGPKWVQKGLTSGFFTHELDPLPNLMDPGGFSLYLNWTDIDLPPTPQKNSGTLKWALKGPKRV